MVFHQLSVKLCKYAYLCLVSERWYIIHSDCYTALLSSNCRKAPLSIVLHYGTVMNLGLGRLYPGFWSQRQGKAARLQCFPKAFSPLFTAQAARVHRTTQAARVHRTTQAARVHRTTQAA